MTRNSILAMNELGITQISLIARDVRCQRITFSHLCDDLIDHVCCDVEDEMENGLSFEKAYRKVKEKIGIRGLNKIQEETLYSVDTKYRRMKNTMKITGIAGTVLLSFAVMFKLMHWPAASVLMVPGIFLLVALFMPTSMMVLWKETKSGRRLLLFVSGFLAATLFIVGVLFKIQHWPGSALLIGLAIVSGAVLFFPSLLAMKIRESDNSKKQPVYVLAFITALLYMAYFLFKIMHWQGASLLFVLSAVLFIIIVPWYVVLEWKDEQSVSSKFIFLVVAYVIFIIPSSLVSLNWQPDYNSGFYTLAENSQKAVVSGKKTNEVYLAMHNDSVVVDRLEKVHQRTLAMMDHIDSLKTQMVSFVSDTENVIVSSEEVNFRQMANLFDATSPQIMLHPGIEAREKLDESLTRYINDMRLLSGEPQLLSEQRLNRLKAILPDSTNAGNTTLISNLHALNLVEAAVILTESDVFRSINEKTDVIK